MNKKWDIHCCYYLYKCIIIVIIIVLLAEWSAVKRINQTHKSSREISHAVRISWWTVQLVVKPDLQF